MKKPDVRTAHERRAFLETAASAGALVVMGCATTRSKEPMSPASGEASGEAEVTPGEDLMQEHGILERILLVYDEASRRLESGQAFDSAPIAIAAGIVRRFVEDYHEKLEEDFVFPRLEAAKREHELVATLRSQHERGRALTDEIARQANAGGKPELARVMRAFTRMYRPHAAREETVLIPAFREVVGRAGYRDLGEKFEEKEHQLFGEHGFEKTVEEVSRIEAALGIADLAAFTPP